ncbi:hypothetical protein WJX81_000896 [Elliptochloris bilobata]|uniref:Uncharacterized protein n=1 Tax=Elliptochloris bilobata TaxID=381761 RepID=A0AAW1QDB2_9CHLO
MLQSRKKYNFW